jgi:hypothetical protein
MTPRMIIAYVRLANRRKRRDMAQAINVAALGARGEPKAMKRLISKLEK